MTKYCIYRCNVCGNIVQKLIDGAGELVCCGEAMEKLKPQTHEENITEKHVPIFLKHDDGTTEVRVGEVLHPMENEHYIMFIETISADDKHIQIEFLKPNDEPKMHIKNCDNMKALEYCNIHGLWEGNND